MTLDQLRIFVEVAARQHITKAAAALNMTQSAVSSAITTLENRHGVKLFDRIGRSIVLNQTGRQFLKEAEAVLAQARVAQAMLDDFSGLMRGELSIMASQTVGGYWLPPRLVHFHKTYPEITLDIQIRNTEETADAVEAGHSEVGIVEGLVDRPALASKIIATDEMVIVVAPGHPWATALFPSIDLTDSAWVLREVGSGTRLAFDRLIERHMIDRAVLDIALVLPSNEAVLVAVEAGIGATLVSRSAASAPLRGGLLCIVDWPAIPRPYYLLRHKERYRSKAASAFETIAVEMPEFEGFAVKG
ncbi:LysR family transcriptional regulator [Rhizobium sp. KVB221]|uniref:HTH-type transcriptional regulator TtuA n=1 Tax=Rhizobium setariae TaxID=2801340 RepID=A0A936YJ35_9HYPH|nr:LysR family transcriptional regulator [Rhizobium setariae]MBL0371083.1 LysR family transcriptional regulator [Rhizobium setariae]